MVYSVQMYVPHQFTHQGVNSSAAPRVGLSRTISGKVWDKDAPRGVLQPVRDWQRDYGAQIYLGEFCAIRWKPDDSAYRYLRDGIDPFEEEGRDLSYHAFREWSGWSVERGPDKADPRPARRRQYLKSCCVIGLEKILNEVSGRNLPIESRPRAVAGLCGLSGLGINPRSAPG